MIIDTEINPVHKGKNQELVPETFHEQKIDLGMTGLLLGPASNLQK